MEAPVPNPQPIYITEDQLNNLLQAMERRIMASVQNQFDEVNTARMQLVEGNLLLQQQLNNVRNAVRALENRYDRRRRDTLARCGSSVFRAR
jgi:hypothetical protein